MIQNFVVTYSYWQFVDFAVGEIISEKEIMDIKLNWGNITRNEDANDIPNSPFQILSIDLVTLDGENTTISGTCQIL